MKNKKNFLITALLLIIACAGFVLFNSNNGNNNKEYDIYKLSRHNITETVEASGTINPISSVNIGSQVSGQIYKLYADYNSEVKKGQLLAEIDPTLFQASVDKAKAEVISSQSSYKKTLANVTYNKSKYGRLKRLYDKHYVSLDEVEAAYAAYISSESELASMQAKISEAQASLATANANLKYTKIISPINGTVISKSVDVGQTVAASFQTPELFVIAEDLTKMQIEANVSEADIDNIHIDQNVQYSIDSYPDVTFNGKVSQIRIEPTTVSNVTTYSVIVDVDNESKILKPGMTANLKFIICDKKDVLAVPNLALKYIPKDSKKKYDSTGIWVLNGRKQARINIQTGAKNSDYTEVISNELKDGTDVLMPKTKNSKQQFRRRGPMGF